MPWLSFVTIAAIVLLVKFGPRLVMEATSLYREEFAVGIAVLAFPIVLAPWSFLVALLVPALYLHPEARADMRETWMKYRMWRRWRGVDIYPQARRRRFKLRGIELFPRGVVYHLKVKSGATYVDLRTAQSPDVTQGGRYGHRQ